ncbi:hypothetical protein [Nitrospirillum viridazoti]|uniref:Uncharacterized protein n=1 Tax=Nitrospirillum viridazoti CBAmc TaxID=1441467 RepID=A0A248JRC5_9PROT|nr:hypothetical protein [Nitrospirillum amazonense]ASG20764.1 hypothetical protein Y958_08040 [Nitrospirillum amazonense CBAmc]
MAERVHPSNGDNGTGASRSRPRARILPARSLESHLPANDNPVPPGRRLKRLVWMTFATLGAVLGIAATVVSLLH